MRECEDCGDVMATGDRRLRCAVCEQLVCGWCHHHVHLFAQERAKEWDRQPAATQGDDNAE